MSALDPDTALGLVTGNPGGSIWSYMQQFHGVSVPSEDQVSDAYEVLTGLERAGKIWSDQHPVLWLWYPGMHECPDGGACGSHHCPSGACFRVHYCAPFTGVYPDVPDGTWPAEVKAAYLPGGHL